VVGGAQRGSGGVRLGPRGRARDRLRLDEVGRLVRGVPAADHRHELVIASWPARASSARPAVPFLLRPPAAPASDRRRLAAGCRASRRPSPRRTFRARAAWPWSEAATTWGVGRLPAAEKACRRPAKPPATGRFDVWVRVGMIFSSSFQDQGVVPAVGMATHEFQASQSPAHIAPGHARRRGRRNRTRLPSRLVQSGWDHGGANRVHQDREHQPPRGPCGRVGRGQP
jgi:hypothetical protein